MGGMDGFKSAVVYFQEDKVSVAYTLNGVVMRPMDILMGVLSIYYSKEYALPRFDGGITLTSKELEAYTGVYSSPSYPLKITIFKHENLLLAQTTGHPAIRLEAYGLHKFKADAAMAKMEFVLKENRMILDQGKRHFFTKEK